MLSMIFFSIAANQRHVYTFKVQNGSIPVGLAIDDAGDLYTGIFGEGKVEKIRPRLVDIVNIHFALEPEKSISKFFFLWPFSVLKRESERSIYQQRTPPYHASAVQTMIHCLFHRPKWMSISLQV